MVSEAMTNHGVTGHKPSPNWGCLLGICIRLFGMAFKWLLDMICLGICDVWICTISYCGLGSYWPALVRWHMLVLYWNWKMPQFVDELLYFNNCDRHLPDYSTGGPCSLLVWGMCPSSHQMGTAYPRIDIYWQSFIIGHATLQEANWAIPVEVDFLCLLKINMKTRTFAGAIPRYCLGSTTTFRDVMCLGNTRSVMQFAQPRIWTCT